MLWREDLAFEANQGAELLFAQTQIGQVPGGDLPLPIGVHDARSVWIAGLVGLGSDAEQRGQADFYLGVSVFPISFGPQLPVAQARYLMDFQNLRQAQVLSQTRADLAGAGIQGALPGEDEIVVADLLNCFAQSQGSGGGIGLGKGLIGQQKRLVSSHG